MIEQPIYNLSLMLSCGCNLSCNYCLIAQSRNQNSHLIQKNTINALQDGSYLNNVVLVLDKLHSSKNYINHIEFWGQEPTLTLNYFTENLSQWLQTFPNVNYFMFSTNGKQYPEKIINFLCELDKIIKHKVTVKIQFSYDGDYSNAYLREVQSTDITQNLNYIISQLNNIKFQHVNLHIQFHAVLSKELINELNTLEKVNNYCENLYNWSKNFNILNLNNAIKINDGVGFGFEVPIEASQEDGINLVKFYKLIENCDFNKTHSCIMSKNIKSIITKAAKFFINEFHQNEYDNLLNIISNINTFDSNIIRKFSQSYSSCGANYNELKIMYDGTLINCQNQIFDTNNDFINKNDLFLYSIKTNENNHKKILNPLKSNNEDIIKVLNTYKAVKETNFLFMYNNILNLILILAKSGQIDKDYLLNEKKLLCHGFIILKYNSCSYNKLIKTGSMIMSNAGQIRLLCNGFLDEVCKGENIL